jgi:hypothetical protein
MLRQAARGALACALFASFAHAQEVPAPPDEIRAEPEVQGEPAVAPAPKARRADPARILSVTLSQAASVAMNKSETVADKSAPVQIGFGRAVPELAAGHETLAHLDWQELAEGGRVSAFSVTSPDAAAIRAGLRIVSLPEGTLLRFYAPAEGEVFETSGAEAEAIIALNLAAQGEGEDARTYWSPVIEGPSVVVEIEIPADADAARVALEAPAISHLITSPGRDFALPSPKAAASCNLDSMCYQGTWGNESNAVARIVYTSGTSSFLCSGTLLVDRDPASAIPYFLTANHCVSTQASASSLQSYWFYRSSACDSGTRGASRTLTGGATLLYASSNTDSSLMRLNSTPPAGATYAGWLVGSIPPLGSRITGIHHPTGDLQKISFGSLRNYASCSATGADSFSCRGGSSLGSTFFETTWSSGITEPGSSGSGLFLDNGHYLIGQLYGGSGACGASGTDFYGRFDAAYNAGLASYLGGAAATGGGGGGGGGGTTPTAPAGPSTFTPALNYSALWWNPSESGWGLSVTQHGSQLFGAWFAYNASGNPMWVVLPAGTWTSATTFTGDLYSTSGPPSTGGFDPSRVGSTRVGTATLSFANADAGVLTYTVNGVAGSKSIRRQSFGVVDNTPVTSYGDLWWNASESGWGLSINQQYRTIFAVWYTYGEFGQPVWYVMPGGSWSGDTYAGTLYRTTAAPLEFFRDPFNASRVASTAVGALSLRFSGANSATMSWTIDGISGSKAVTRQPF